MPVNMIDLATMAPRSQEASQVQNNTQRHYSNAEYNTGVQFNQEIKHDSQKTVASKKDAEADFETGEREGSAKGHANSERRDKRKQEEEAPMAPRSNSSFDIMI